MASFFPMFNALIRKLDCSGFLTEVDRVTLQKVTSRRREVAPKRDLILEGDRPEYVQVVLSGFACRYKLLRGGQRHIMALLVPGDFCDLHVAILGQMDHAIATLTTCTTVEVSRSTIEDLTDNHPRITRALWWATLIDEGILREWLANMGQRPADRQIAHLFCELHVRLLSVGLAGPSGFSMPLRQVDLADMLGLTPVHVNRSLQELRAAGLLTLQRRWLEVLDVDRLRTFCDFKTNYLHLTPRVDGLKT
ncbi:Crp/Fnr family transcriptional regulator [Methylobacterium sp. J-070]|uniref:Crp/Fnr family transcriptional regulator n=1 Tax=Methylobacterium sp. J-070 TaxID=2836650 RepID=UPI001FB8CA0C|nr:Crp/Fnr family transcriptional regulator [Methylobacterium sp. J-070]MCJ2049814.1 Crp/Fnr family transcriptional regulator [Methylobacterium sp. J-070]